MFQASRIRILLLIAYSVLMILGGHWVWNTSHQSLLNDHQSNLDRFSVHIASQLDKFAHIPELLSKDKELVDALHSPSNTAQIELTNRYLEHVNTVIQASDTYLLDSIGTTIAASNWNLKHSFVGRNFAFRPYYQQAIQGHEKQYFALGSTSGKRGYYYSYPVSYAAEIIGVIVVKMDLSSIEASWQGKQSFFVADDKDQIIFMSSNPEWLFKSLQPLDNAQQARIRENQQYLDTQIESLHFSGDLEGATSSIRSSHPLVREKFFTSSRFLPDPGLTVRVFSPTHLVWWDLVAYMVVLSLVFAIIYLVIQLNLHRQHRRAQIDRLQSEANQKLEFQVLERTSELHGEIKQRIETERVLRHTQDELIQAAKLAVLGQMSASISHELNNPLAAIRSYADNGRLFLAKEKIDRVDDNLSRISALTDRMAKISHQLRSFAKKSTAEELHTLQILPILHSSKELMKPQFKSERVKLNELPETFDVCVLANAIQLEQVIINLLTNAVQAMEEQDDKQLAILLEIKETDEAQDNTLLIHIDDNGPGFTSSSSGNFFEPFHTTKKNGLGLGLSISQQIISGINGKLTTGTSPQGGARFSIELPVIEQQ
ncbi:Histidine kinase [Vibrio chagasii]|uniref:sensor histidine kinase n=1 Tax=Vibrio TaxID=662 RepID=UPI001493AE81|nr:MULTISPECIES: ATP-binding protein [Vibrio]MDE9382410.1 ATP-binding protein [Vibrio alginolyticus]MCG9567396.1 ATP-binding protein [Vibrio chagasii]MCG9603622.1 ATP-binding protein [Vibrio chagasii]NOI36886.1 sensor histidine kinase [Vibrio sp. 070316B]NOI87661.1 sensor histidine kinase [Vibrio sp. 99K-1]